MPVRDSSARLLLAFLVLTLGGVTAFIMLRTAPKTEPTEKPRPTKIVQTMNIAAATEAITVTAEGTVIPTREVTVKPEIRGLIVRHHPALVVGGRLLAGEELIGIDDADYKLALQEQRSALEEAKYELAVEQGRQVIAEREFRLLQKDLNGDDVNQALVLRKPHLDRAEAALTKAQNEIAKAELNLTRTSIHAPFNAVVINESVEIGQLVEAGSPICTLAGTDAFWVSVTLPMEDLQWIQFPKEGQQGAKAMVSFDTGKGPPVRWNGTVERLLGDLDTTTRLARLVVRVDNPLDIGSTDKVPKLPLLIGNYVRVDIDAGMLDNVLTIPRGALRAEDTLWLVDDTHELQIRKTEVKWPLGETLLVSNTMKPGEQLIVSDLRAALPGMKVLPQPATLSPTP